MNKGSKRRKQSTNPVPALNAGLLQFFRDPRSDAYFGRTFLLRAEVLAWLLAGKGQLQHIARRYGVAKSALSPHVKRASELYSSVK